MSILFLAILFGMGIACLVVAFGTIVLLAYRWRKDGKEFANVYHNAADTVRDDYFRTMPTVG